MGKKKSKLEEIKNIKDIKKKRKRLMELRKEKLDVDETIESKGKKKEIDVRLEQETKLYWARAITGFAVGLIGRLIGFVGWLMLIWMVIWWFLFPFFVSFVIYRFEYNKETWNWKNIIKPGIGIYFFIFMITSTIIHTLCVYWNYPLNISIWGFL
ncbi:MAG: hypothetical protein EU547_00210 [Promethearchaeota archaeon]|nr:MAG: hypothetical protein EU547_00210 [Candidatus Lokiarchaeota archaeon]